MNEVADWENDPKFGDLENIVADRRSLVRWSYGGILYKDFRCAWVHKFGPESDQIRTIERDHFDRDAPYYRYVTNRDTFLLIMPVSFLSLTLERAIRSFEQETATRKFVPFKH